MYPSFFHTVELKRRLSQFVVTSNVQIGRLIGTGAFATVKEVKVEGLNVVGKFVPDNLVSIDEKSMNMYVKECVIMSTLTHPNVVQFCGVYFQQDKIMPVMLMQRMDIDLACALKQIEDIPLSVKFSIFVDVARGLAYLHSRFPPIIHRGLTPKHVLLSSSLVAKISGLHWARVLDNIHPDVVASFTKAPGPDAYMPPEASGQYGSPLDIFSFGHLMLVTSIQVSQVYHYTVD